MVKGRFKRVQARLIQFGLSDRASAAVEFALILPIMLVVYFGTMEGSTLIIVDRKVQSVAGAVGDLVARADKQLKRSDLEDYFRAASGIMAPYESSEVVQMVTAIKVLANGTTDVVWQSRYQNGDYTEVPVGDLPEDYFLPQEMIDITSPDDMVISAEVSYAFKPLLGVVFDQAINLHRSNFYMPRFGDGITLID